MEFPLHRPRPECWPCIMDISLGALNRAVADEGKRFELMREIAEIMAHDLDQASNLPVVSTKIFRLVSERTGSSDPFSEEKRNCNRIALPLAGRECRKVLGIRDPETRLRTAALASIAGNTMDLGTSGHSFDLSRFEKEYESILQQGLAIDDTVHLLRAIRDARTVIYLADNAGEIAFDKVLVLVISNLGPKVTVAVKGGAISNDATLEDAAYVGMKDVADVITTGTDHLGVSFEESSREFLDAFASSDLVVSKGQSNLETLSYSREEIGRPVCLILRAKCPPIARALGVKLGHNVLRLV